MLSAGGKRKARKRAYRYCSAADNEQELRELIAPVPFGMGDFYVQ